jgi:hypothetical protein
MEANYTFGITSGLIMLTIGSLGSTALRANRRLLLWKATDPFGRLAFVGMIVFCISVIAKAVRHFT